MLHTHILTRCIYEQNVWLTMLVCNMFIVQIFIYAWTQKTYSHIIQNSIKVLITFSHTHNICFIYATCRQKLPPLFSYIYIRSQYPFYKITCIQSFTSLEFNAWICIFFRKPTPKTLKIFLNISFYSNIICFKYTSASPFWYPFLFSRAYHRLHFT